MHFDSDLNTVHVLRPRWAKVTAALGRGGPQCQPLQVEGVACTSALQVLVHSAAHELVHALVHLALPDLEDAEAYTANRCHGPIFTLLNKMLFGHMRLTV